MTNSVEFICYLCPPLYQFIVGGWNVGFVIWPFFEFFSPTFSNSFIIIIGLSFNPKQSEFYILEVVGLLSILPPPSRINP